ncbi:sorting nexin-19-like [Physella acuta]|uniref:sorting nexin-19-like n=1 Tax=Physella acuta TaxID=109671 RepID=UPI0027DE49A2|nr:sorting nexin-19-like [Physella acuta]
MAGREAFLGAISEAWNLRAYSSAQKLVLLFSVTILLSWITSVWTLPLVVLISFVTAVQLSSQILHNKKASLVTEQIFVKLESVYVEYLTNFKYVFQPQSGKSSNSSSLLVCNDHPSPVQMSNDVCSWSEEINSIQLLIIRDFFESWYHPHFSYDGQFLKEVRQLVQQAFKDLVQHLSQQNSKITLMKIIQQYHIHFISYQKAKKTFESHKIHPKTKVVQNDRFKRHSSIDDAFETVASVHNALESEKHELNYLKGVVSVLVLSVFSEQIVEGPCVRTLLVEILAANIMLPIMQLLSNPDWLMEVIIQITSDEHFEPNNLSATVDNMISAQSECIHVNFDDESKPTAASAETGFVKDDMCDNYDEVKELVNPDSFEKSHLLETALVDSTPSWSNLDQINLVLDSTGSVLSRLDCDTAALDVEESDKLTDIPHATSSSPDDDKPKDDCEDDDDGCSLKEDSESTADSCAINDFLADQQSSTTTEVSALSASTESTSEVMSSSFSKLSSLKNFFVDQLKPQSIKKPKSLSLTSTKLKATSIKLKGNADGGQNPPQLLVDGIPLDAPALQAGRSGISQQCSPTLSDTEQTPSPGFLYNSCSSLSPLHEPISQQSSIELSEESPCPTPSPSTQHLEFNVADDAVIKDSDNRIFQDISIPKTMTNTEFRSTTQYSLYIIEYEALYFSEGNPVIRSGLVKRRYREFINLHSRLEGNQSYRKHLKKIRGPKRWPSFPFKSVDKETVESRRIFLEKYLKDLIEVEAICLGPDLREFLAYEGDSHIAFVNKSPDITVPRFDKMLMRGVSGVVDRIKALPNIPQEVMSGFRSRDTPDHKHPQSDSDAIDFISEFSPQGVNENSNNMCESFKQLLRDFVSDEDKELFSVSDVITDYMMAEQTKEVYKQEVDKIRAQLPTTDQSASSELGLSYAVLDLLIQGLQGQDHWMCRDRVVKSIQSVLSKAFNRYLESSLEGLLTESQLAFYLRHLRETIWPQGQLRSRTGSVLSEEERQDLKLQAKRCLLQFFPESLRYIVGKKDFEMMIEQFLCSIESEQLNKHFWYNSLDLLVCELFPEVKGQEMLQNLLFCKSWKR